jgi:hypothetical protein
MTDCVFMRKEANGLNLRLPRKPVPRLALEALTEPQPQAAYAYWQAKRQGRAMPAPNDIDPAEIPKLLPYMTLIEVLHEEPVDYVYRIEGEAVRLAFGFRRMGERLSAIEDRLGAAYPGFRDRLETVRFSREPLAHSSMMTQLRHKLFVMETVLLPLSRSGEGVDRIMACTGFIAQR